MSTIKKFLSDTIIYGLTTIVSRMINFLLTPIYLRTFKDAALYGVYMTFYSWMSMFNAFLAFGMETSFFRFLNKVEKQDRAKVFNNTFIVTVFTSVLLLISVFIWSDNIGAWFAGGQNAQEYSSFVSFFAWILVADALAVIPFAKLRADNRALRYSALKFINIFITILGNLFLLLWLPAWIETSSFWASFAAGWYVPGWIGYVFICNLVASVVTLMLLLPELKTLQLKIDKPLMRAILSYSFPILIANISFIVNEHLDKMFFTKLIPGVRGETELGIYGAVAKIAVFLNLFVTAFRLGVEPFFFSYAKAQNAKSVYAMIMEYFVLLMVLVMIGITVNLSWLKSFIEGNDLAPDVYWSGLKVVPFILFNFVLLGIYMNLSVWYKLTDKTRYALYVSGIGALVTIVLNIVLIPRFSYVGAVASTTVVYLLMISLSLYWGQRHYAIPYKFSKIGLYILIGLVLCTFSFFVLNSNFWLGNALLILFCGGCLWMERQQIRKLLRRK